MSLKSLSQLPINFALWLVWICFTFFSVGYLAGRGTSDLISALPLSVSLILLLLFRRGGNFGRD